MVDQNKTAGRLKESSFMMDRVREGHYRTLECVVSDKDDNWKTSYHNNPENLLLP